MNLFHPLRKISLLLGATIIAVSLNTSGCAKRVQQVPLRDHVTNKHASAALSEGDLGLIEDIGPKIGEAGSTGDPVVIKVVSLGTNAVPFLLEKIVDDSPVQVYDGFRYSVGDVAHRLLCEIYFRNFLWPVAGAAPIGGHPQVSFQDYLAFVHAPSGREKLQQMWKEHLKR